MIRIKRVYEPLEKSDGYRILVDRLWPRGIKKEDAHVDIWMKEIAPSTPLRKWFHSHLGHWTQFVKKYQEELHDSPALEEFALLLKKHQTVTLLYAAKDEEHNHAIVLEQYVSHHAK